MHTRTHTEGGREGEREIEIEIERRMHYITVVLSPQLCQKIALLDQLSPTASKADYIKDLTTCQEDVVTTYRNWLQLVKPFAIGGKLSSEVEEACQIAGEVISGYHRQVEDMRKVRQVEQEANKVHMCTHTQTHTHTRTHTHTHTHTI